MIMNNSSSVSAPSPMLRLHKLNGDSSWLIRLPLQSSSFNILIDPWLDPTCQIDGSASFSKQTRLQSAQFANIAQLSEHLLGKMDAIIFSHPFTDHMHPETLRDEGSQDVLRQAKVITTKDSHPALMGLKLDLDPANIINLGGKKNESVSLADGIKVEFLPAREWFVSPAWAKLHGAIYFNLPGYEILYTPHGIAPTSLLPHLKQQAKEGTKRILIHSFDRQTLPILGPVTLGFPNIKELKKTFRPDVVLGTHDEHKQAEGFIAKVIKRTEYSIEMVQQELGETVTVRALNAGEEIEV